MSLYLDGARVLNACSALKIAPKKYVENVDLLNLCFSKGLGAPFGSVLVGSSRKIEQARIYRKWYGGCLHQSGLMAGIALDKLKRWDTFVKKDNKKAFLMYRLLRDVVKVKYPAQTNMMFVEVDNVDNMVSGLKDKGVLTLAWKPDVICMVFSNLVTFKEVEQAVEIIESHYKS